MRLRFALFLLIWLASNPVQSEAQSCPEGVFESTLGSGCLRPHEWEDPDAFNKPMSFTMRQVSIRAETTWIAAEGIITKDTPHVFREFLTKNLVYTENRIEFHSPGGNLYAALELGRIIRSIGNPTTIGRTLTLKNPEASMDVIAFPDAVCFSACAYAFFGGERRYLGGGVLGVHRFGSYRYGITVDEAQVASSDISRYLEEMGIDQRVFQIASRTAFEGEVFSFDEELAKELRIVFDPSDRTSRIEIRLLGKNVVADTIVFHKWYEYAARIHCIDGYPRLVIWGDKQNFPKLYHNLPPSVAKFGSGAEEFFTAVEAGVLRNGNAYLTFSGWDIPKFLIENNILNLKMIYPKTWDELELFDKIQWADAGTWMSFSLRVENAPETLPIVMRECG